MDIPDSFICEHTCKTCIYLEQAIADDPCRSCIHGSPMEAALKQIQVTCLYMGHDDMYQWIKDSKAHQKHDIVQPTTKVTLSTVLLRALAIAVIWAVLCAGVHFMSYMMGV